MKKLLIVGLLLAMTLTACSPKNDVAQSETVQNDSDNEVTSEVAEETADEVVEDVDENSLSEDEVLAIYESAMADGNYDRAGYLLSQWLSVNKSDKVEEKMQYIIDNVYVSASEETCYDKDDNELCISLYEYDTHGNSTYEEYRQPDGYDDSFSYSYSYENDLITLKTCYDSNDELLSLQECEYNDDGLCVVDTIKYSDDCIETQTSEYDEEGHCVTHTYVYTYAEGEEQCITRCEWDGDNRVGEYTYNVYDDGTEELASTFLYEYYDDGNVKSESYIDIETGEPLNVSYYEYDEDGNVTSEKYVYGDYSEEYVNTYEDGLMVSTQFFVEGQLSGSYVYEYDFLGNVVATIYASDDDAHTCITNYTYKLK